MKQEIGKETERQREVLGGKLFVLFLDFF